MAQQQLRPLPADFDFGDASSLKPLPADFNFDEPATPKKEPSFGSRLYDSTLGAVEKVSDRVQSAMRSRNPIGSLFDAGVDATKGAYGAYANSPLTKAGNPIGGAIDAMVRPVVKPIVEDVRDGRYGAAAGGITGMLLPFAPKGIKAAARLDRAALLAGAKGAAKGGATGGVEALLDSTRSPITAMDVLVPGAKKAKMGAKTASGIYQGIKAGAKDELAKLEIRRRQAANPPRASTTVDSPVDPIPDATPIPGQLPSGRQVGPAPQRTSNRPAAQRVDSPTSAPADATPIRGDLPSGRRPLTAAEREAKYAKVPKAPESPPPADHSQELLDGLAQSQLKIPSFKKVPQHQQKAIRKLADKINPKPTAVDPKSPEGIAMMQELADEYNPQQTPKGKPTDFEGAARAKKVWNLSDKLHEKGWTTDNLHEISQEELLMTVDELSDDIAKEWKAAGSVGKRPPRHGAPSAETIRQTVKEMAEIEARKAKP